MRSARGNPVALGRRTSGRRAAIGGIIGSALVRPVDDETAGGLVDDEARFGGRQLVAGVAYGHAEARLGPVVAPALMPVDDPGGDLVGEGGAAWAVADDAEFPEPALLILAFADGQVRQAVTVERGHRSPCEMGGEAGAGAGHAGQAVGQDRSEYRYTHSKGLPWRKFTPVKILVGGWSRTVRIASRSTSCSLKVSRWTFPSPAMGTRV